MIEVILLERVEKLGHIGDIVRVKPGFARNFLLPRKKALRATEAAKKQFEEQRAHIEADNLKRKQDAEKAAAKLDGKTVVLIRQAGDSGQLYGSVSSRDIAEAFAADGVSVGKAQVILDKPIKALGMHGLRLSLHPEVSVAVRANVARSKDEAELQAKGVDVMARQAEEERADAEAAAAERAAAAAAVREEAAGPAEG